MKLIELCNTAQSIAGQNRPSTLWGFEDMKVFANEAEDEAAARSRLILDIETEKDAADAPVCKYPTTQGNFAITLHPKIMFVRWVKLDSSTIELPRIHFRDLKSIAPDWSEHPQGDVVAYCPNWQKGKLLFYRSFEGADVVRLQVIRRPLKKMVGPDDSPEIDEQHHMGLVNWMLMRMYDKLDPETANKVKVKDYEAKFEAQFGKRSSAIDETWIQREHGYDELEGLF